MNTSRLFKTTSRIQPQINSTQLKLLSLALLSSSLLILIFFWGGDSNLFSSGDSQHIFLLKKMFLFIYKFIFFLGGGCNSFWGGWIPMAQDGHEDGYKDGQDDHQMSHDGQKWGWRK